MKEDRKKGANGHTVVSYEPCSSILCYLTCSVRQASSDIFSHGRKTSFFAQKRNCLSVPMESCLEARRIHFFTKQHIFAVSLSGLRFDLITHPLVVRLEVSSKQSTLVYSLVPFLISQEKTNQLPTGPKGLITPHPAQKHV